MTWTATSSQCAHMLNSSEQRKNLTQNQQSHQEESEEDAKALQMSWIP